MSAEFSTLGGALPVCWINGRLCGAQDASISIFDHGFLYGDGVFEGLRFYQGKVFLAEAHLQRLADSAQALGIVLPRPLQEIGEIMQGLVRDCGVADGYIRLIVTRGTGPLGLNPKPCKEPSLIFMLDHLQLVDDEAKRKGLKLITSSIRRAPADVLNPRIKSLNYLNNILARMEANTASADEALMLNHQGRVAEGSAENVFCIRRGIVQTPPCIDGALEGITRNLVMQLARDAGMKVEETSLTPFDLYCAEEVFLTGSGAELLPVGDIDGRKIARCPGPVFRELEERFREFVRCYSRD